jgi:hypothetical protein
MTTELNINKSQLVAIKKHLFLFSHDTVMSFLFTAFSLVGCIVIFSSYNNESFISWNNSIKVSSTVTSLNKTKFGIGDDLSSTLIYEYGYSYLLEDSTYIGKSYSTGKRLSVNEEITVLVQNKSLDKSKINGLPFRCFPFDLWALILVILPLLGLFVLIKRLREAIICYTIIENGSITIGSYLGSQETNEEENEIKLYKHLIKYYVDGEDILAEHKSIEKCV